jgi:hypothetical protein
MNYAISERDVEVFSAEVSGSGYPIDKKDNYYSTVSLQYSPPDCSLGGDAYCTTIC